MNKLIKISFVPEELDEIRILLNKRRLALENTFAYLTEDQQKVRRKAYDKSFKRVDSALQRIQNATKIYEHLEPNL